MADSKPIRLTKQRINALRTVVDKGMYEIETNLVDAYGVDIHSMGTDEFRLLDEADREDVAKLLDEYWQAHAAWQIIARRYG